MEQERLDLPTLETWLWDAAIIVAHNHPSGQLQPSPEDLAVTKKLYDAGQILGIELRDHLIITKTGWLSLRREGYF